MAETGEDGSLPHAEEGLWTERTSTRTLYPGRPALFLDRDGTINVDTGYPSDPDAVVLRTEILPVIRAGNNAGVAVVMVTNQSGIARGYFGWSDFAAVNDKVLDLLMGEGCSVDFVVACAYHEEGIGAFRATDHPMRKPSPGMLLHAAEMLELDLSASIMVGDKASDMEAARAAGLSAGWLIGEPGHVWAGFDVRPLVTADDHNRLLAAIAAMV